MNHSNLKQNNRIEYQLGKTETDYRDKGFKITPITNNHNENSTIEDEQQQQQQPGNTTTSTERLN
jgi:hypothetical protein